MKKILYIIAAAVALMSVSSCLDRYPITAISEDTYINSAAGVEGTLVSAYAACRNFYGEQWRYNELRSDNGRNRVIEMEGRHIDQHYSEFYIQSNTNDGLNTYLWKPAYTIINRCNIVLDNIDKVTSPTNKAKFQAEALFLRSLVYFDMIRLFKDVYYVTKQISAQEALEMKPTPNATILESLITDMEKVAADNGGLPTPDAQPTSEIGRATTFAAKTLLAKMYLTKKEYAKVASTLAPIISKYGTTDLVPFDQIFRINNEMNKELIFCVRFSGPDKGMGSSINNYFACYGEEGKIIDGEANGFCYPSDGLLNLFGIKYVWEASNGDVYVPGVNTPSRIKAESVDWSEVVDKRAAVTVAWDLDKVSFWSSKYYGSKAETFKKYDNENDWPVFRYADVLLMSAEALENTDKTTAVKYVNAIRTRAGLPDLTQDEITDLHNSILRERRLEFVSENQRYFDLLREGDQYLIKVMNDQFNNEPYYQTLSGSIPRPGDITSADQIPLPVPFDMEVLYE